MYVLIDLIQAKATLEDVQDFTSFAIWATAPAPDATRLARSLGELGRLRTDGQHADLSVEHVRRLAGPMADETWNRRFRSMIEYARTRGWTDPSASLMRAHIEWT